MELDKTVRSAWPHFKEAFRLIGALYTSIPEKQSTHPYYKQWNDRARIGYVTGLLDLNGHHKY